MKQYFKTTPEGTRDLFFEECEIRREIEQNLADFYKQRGFSEIITPGIEFYDLFSNSAFGLPEEMLYKLIDNKGRLLVIRPDSTLPISRVVATRLKDASLPIRLFYTQDIFKINPSMKGRSDETVQSGIELIGADGLLADLEVITTAIDALDKVGSDNFIIELGHAGFFKSLIKTLDIAENKIERIRTFIENKNYSALGDFLNKLNQTNAVKALKKLPELFGGNEVLTQAKLLCKDNSEAMQTLEYLNNLYENLCKLNLTDRITIDLGLVHENDYYSGVIFRGYVNGYGDVVLSGGRYNNLLSTFGRSLPATGFALNVNSLSAINIQNRNFNINTPDILICAKEGFEISAIKYRSDKILEGKKCELNAFNDLNSAKKYAKSKNIKQIDIVGKEIESINL
jgi:ATP phosphoribosyltransferase, regulatory subunit